jgi:pimeloyl-ACP methyl ester carboxylesterase
LGNQYSLYQQANYDLFIFDYRGYGKSTGKIESEKQLLDDIEKAWHSVIDEYKNKKIVIYGRSLGTSLATHLAKKFDPDLLVLVSPFTSMLEMAQSQYPFLPKLDWLVRYPLRSDQWIQQVNCKTLFLHGSNDTLIPTEHSYRLQALINAPNQLFIINNAGHNDIHRFDEYHQKIIEALP